MPLTEKQREWIATYTEHRRQGVVAKTSRFSFEKLTQTGQEAEDNLNAMESFQRRAEKAGRLLLKLQALHLPSDELRDLQREMADAQQKAETGDFVRAKTDITDLKTRLGKVVLSQKAKVEKREKGAKKLLEAVTQAREALAKVAALRGVPTSVLYTDTAKLVKQATDILERIRAGETVSESDQLNAIAILRPVVGNCTDLEQESVKAREVAHQEVEAIKAWGKLLRRYEPEVEELFRLPGAADRKPVQDAVQAVAGLRPLAQRHIDDGVGAGGYVAAMQEMQGWEELAAEARKRSLFLTLRWQNHDLKKLTGEVQAAIEVLSGQATDVQVALFTDALKSITSQKESDGPERALRGLLREVTSETERLTTAHLDAVKEITAWGQELDHGLLPPRSDRRLRLRLEAAIELGAERYWEDVLLACKRGVADTKALIEETTNHQEAWAAAAQRLREARALGAEMALWFPVADTARNLLDDARAVLEGYEKDEQVVIALEDYTKRDIDARYQDFLRRVTDEQMPRGDEVKLFYTAYTSGTRTLDDEASRVMKSIEVLKATVAQQGRKLRDAFLTPFDLVGYEWQQVTVEPPPDPLQALPDIFHRCMEAYKSFEAKILLATTPQGLEKILQSCEQAGEEELVERIEAALQTLKDLKHGEVDRLRQEMEASRGSRRKRADLVALERVAQEAEDYVSQHRSTVSREQELVQTERTQVLGALKKRKVPNDFQPYLDRLAEEADDIDQLVKSGDPSLIAAAASRLASLAQKVNRQEDHKEVEALISKISNTLGEDSLREDMPETQGRLLTALKEAIHKATRADVATGLGLLQPLQVEVDNAFNASKGHVAKVKNLKSSLEDAVKRFESARPSRVSVAGNLEFYAKAFEAKKAEIEALLKKESGVAEAAKKLDALHKELDELPTDALGLKQVEAAAAEVARRNKDRFRLLHAEVLELKESVLLPLEKASKNDKSIDKKLLNNIRKQLTSAKKMMATASPLAEEAEAQYQEVRKIVQSSREALERLLGQEGDSRIKVSKNLRKVAAYWTRQALAFGATIRAVAVGIAEETASDPSEEVVKQGEQAEALLRTLVALFPPSAFDRPFAVLLATADDKKPPTRERKDAREAALRTMRRLRTLLLRHPLLKKLAHKNNPFEGPRILAATAMVRAALKRVERSLLVTA